jgi:biopolymer transport protein ExbB
MIAIAMARIHGLLEIGGPVVGALMFLSVVALTCILWKFVVFLMQGVGAKGLRGDAAKTLSTTRSAHAKGVPAGALRERTTARLEAGFENVGTGLRLLDVIAQIAPLLGLFGTVLGMIDAFRTLQDAGGTADPAVLAGGIWVALITTAAGLVVAMPTSMALTWFDARLDRHRSRTFDALEDILMPKVFDAEGNAHG